MSSYAAGGWPPGLRACLIPVLDNRSGGGKPSNFYYDNRVLDGDVFKVQVR